MFASSQFRTFYLLVCGLNVKIRIYREYNFACILYECDSWSLILRKEHEMKIFQNRVLRRIFGPKGDETAGGWKKNA
jgi:hypothetical protein